MYTDAFRSSREDASLLLHTPITIATRCKALFLCLLRTGALLQIFLVALTRLRSLSIRMRIDSIRVVVRTIMGMSR